MRPLRLILAYSLRGLTILLVSYALFANAMAQAQSLEILEAIASEAKSLTDFLAPKHADLRERYFAALQKYFGTRITRQIFDDQIAELTRLSENVEGFDARIWETKGLGEKTSITSRTFTSGRNLNVKAWNDFLSAWRSRIAVAGGRALLIEDPAERKEFVIRVLVDAQSQIDRVQKNSQALPRIERNAKNRELFTGLEKDPSFQAAVATVLHTFLSTELTRDTLRAQDPDLILELIHHIHQHPDSVMLGDLKSLPRGWISFLKPLIPSKTELLNDKAIFPYRTIKSRSGEEIPVGTSSAETYDFVPFPRRLHSIWKNVPIGECVGHCTQRWGTSLIADSQHFSVERAGQPSGFISLVPGQLNGRTYASPDFSSPFLKTTVMIKQEDKPSLKTNLLELWLREASALLPRDWNGIVLGDSTAGDNAGGGSLARSSPAYIYGKSVGHGEQYSVEDPLALAVAKASPTTIYYREGSLGYDAALNKNQSSTLRLLDPSQPLGIAFDAGNAFSEANSPVWVRHDLIDLEHMGRGVVPAKLIKDYFRSATLADFFAATKDLGPGAWPRLFEQLRYIDPKEMGRDTLKEFSDALPDLALPKQTHEKLSQAITEARILRDTRNFQNQRMQIHYSIQNINYSMRGLLTTFLSGAAFSLTGGARYPWFKEHFTPEAGAGPMGLFFAMFSGVPIGLTLGVLKDWRETMRVRNGIQDQILDTLNSIRRHDRPVTEQEARILRTIRLRRDCRETLAALEP